MDESTLRIFLTLCETENTRDAAALLRVNQSNVSRALARLELQVGAELFTRHGRRLSLNRAGDAFQGDAAQILERYEAARAHLDQVVGSKAVIRLGFLQSVARWAVPRLIGSFRQVAPESRFELRQGFSRDLFGWIASDALDVAIVTPPSAPAAGLGWHPLVEQRLCVAVPRDHRLSRCASLRTVDIDGEDLVAFSRTTELRTVIDTLLAEAGVRVRIAFESSEIDTIRGLVNAGLGLAIIPEPSTTDASDPVFVPFVPTTARRIGLAWSAERTNPVSVADFLDHSQKTFDGFTKALR
jgi:DNA-binding transcriptional LysR family regulator